MKNKEFYKLLKKNQANSGFTLIELLVGLVMSIFVIGALGFGLMTVLQTNQRENSKVKARTENSRALDFISDEVRRARNIETDTTFNAPGFTKSPDKTVILALDIPDISATSKIVYYLSSNIGPNWKGPQVLYRWGPPLNEKGEYTNGAWDNQALIDGINATPVTNPCSTGTVTTINPTGFYACAFLTDPTKAYDPISLIPDPLDPSQNIQNPNYNPRNTAQLFLTGQTKTATGVNDSQTNDTQVVARARTRAANTTNTFSSISWSMKSLGGKYECKRSPSVKLWDMRTDFGNDSTDPNKTTTWIQGNNASSGSSGTQPQPLEVDPTKDLTITSSAILDDLDPKCNSIGNSNVNGKESLSDPKYVNKVPIEVKFDNPATFNGDGDGNLAYNVSEVKTGDPRIQFLKKGEIPLYGGYTANPTAPSSDDQPSLGKFLYDNKMAIISPTNNTNDDPATPADERLSNPLTKFIIPTPEQLAASNLTATQKSEFTFLEDDQRIVAFEVGQTDTTLPGFDLQDNIFVVTSDVFKTKFESSCFSGSSCNPSTGKPN